MNDTMDRLNNLFGEHGVDAKVTTSIAGPTTTRYETQLGAGVKAEKVYALAETITVETGKETIIKRLDGRRGLGIDIPNDERTTIPYATFDFGLSHPLTVPLGVDSDNYPVLLNLGDLPHLIVAGATGSGKSVYVNALIATLINRTSPTVVRTVLVDMKRVEFANYRDAPHLWAPIATVPRTAIAVLQAVVDEMDQRYALLEDHGYKTIEAYNADRDVAGAPQDTKPYLVVVVDELADLSGTERAMTAIGSLAQKGRAAGIHLVLATQRPSVKVIAGDIKNNVPARLAFAVPSVTDSRVVLDRTGAQKLLGMGDALFIAPVASKREPTRVQAPFISDEEIRSIVRHARADYPDTTYVVQAPPAEPQPAVQPPTTPAASSVPTRRPEPTKPATTPTGGGWKTAIASEVRATGYVKTGGRSKATMVGVGLVAVIVLLGLGKAVTDPSSTPLPDPTTTYTTITGVPPTP